MHAIVVMRPARRFDDRAWLSLRLVDRIEPRIGVGLENPEINRSYAMMATHYGVGIVPARPYRPRDKTSVSYCTSFGLSRVDTFQPCRTRAAPTMALDDLQAWRDVPKPTPKTV